MRTSLVLKLPVTAALSLALAGAFASAAVAQQPAGPPAGADSATPPASAAAPATDAPPATQPHREHHARVAPPTPPAPVFIAIPMPPAPAPPVDERTDHAKIVGKFGVSWLGISEIPIADATPTGTASQPGLSPNDRVDIKTVSAPVLGVRYWLNGFLAVEPGIGFNYTGGSTKSDLAGQKAEVDKKSTTAMMFHVGAPMAFASAKHLALLVIPEVNIGFAKSNVKSLITDNGPPDAHLSGLRIDAGARVGAEMHFGFMGMPELSLEGSVGLLYSWQRASAEVAKQQVTDTNVQLTTSSFNNPWDIFRGIGTVAARYYF